jgi:hypothetical protein
VALFVVGSPSLTSGHAGARSRMTDWQTRAQKLRGGAGIKNGVTRDAGEPDAISAAWFECGGVATGSLWVLIWRKFCLDTFVDFFTVHGDILRCVDAQTDLKALDAENRDGNFVTNVYAFAYFACEYQHNRFLDGLSAGGWHVPLRGSCCRVHPKASINMTLQVRI